MTVLDASVMVSALNPDDVYHQVSRAWLRQHIIAGQPVTAPILILSEIAGAIARRTNDSARGRRAVAQFRSIPRLTLVRLDRELAGLSVDLAAALRLRGADAVYVALAAALKVPLVTWDREQRERGGHVVDARRPSDA